MFLLCLRFGSYILQPTAKLRNTLDLLRQADFGETIREIYSERSSESERVSVGSKFLVGWKLHRRHSIVYVGIVLVASRALARYKSMD